MLELSLFGILSLFLLGGALTLIYAKQTLYSAFGFLIAMIALAGHFALLQSRFLAMAQIMVSVGAVVVLSMLTILTVNAKTQQLPDEPHKLWWMLFASALISPLLLLLYRTLSTLGDRFGDLDTQNVSTLGATLFSDWVLPFELLSILLLSAMVGAMVIARRNTKERS